MCSNSETKRMRLGLAIGLALAIGAAHAEFPSELELSALNGTNGFALNGVAAADHSGRSVSAVGDVNGDGIDDQVIGAPDADPNALFAGASYVVFGTAQGFSTPLNLSTLNGSNGFVINGEGKFDGAGTSVRSAGDFNGDGIADLVVGAPDASTNADFSGSTYVVFGRAQGCFQPTGTIRYQWQQWYCDQRRDRKRCLGYLGQRGWRHQCGRH